MNKTMNDYLKQQSPKVYLGALNLFFLRREQDSNLRTGFAGYTLSRRASSTTRAPLLAVVYRFAVQRYEIFKE